MKIIQIIFSLFLLLNYLKKKYYNNKVINISNLEEFLSSKQLFLPSSSSLSSSSTKKRNIKYNIKIKRENKQINLNTLTHPTIKLIKNRKESNSKPLNRQDNEKIGLVIEGGGMRGCVAAGAALAINYLQLNDCFDLIYGSSAGSMIGSYFISNQTKYAYDIYCRSLPKAKGEFVKLILCGKEIFPKLFHSNRNLLNLDYLLKNVMNQSEYSLDWNQFIEGEKKQPLSIITSDVTQLQSMSLSRKRNSYNTKDQLLNCLRASMLVPGVTGNIMKISDEEEIPNIVPNQPKIRKNYFKKLKSKFSIIKKINEIEKEKEDKNIEIKSVIDNNNKLENIIHLVDAFVCEPIPYRTAIKDNCTHIVVLRTKPDPSPTLGIKTGIYERIAKKFFLRNNETKASLHFDLNQPKLIYAEDILRLNEGISGPINGVDVSDLIENSSLNEKKFVHLLPIAPINSKEISQIEMNSKRIFQGMIDGARRVLEVFGGINDIKTSEDIEKHLKILFPEIKTTKKSLKLSSTKIKPKLKLFFRK